MDRLLKEELEILLKEGLDALSKEELRELRRQIIANLPIKQQYALLSGEGRMPQEEYDKFVYTQLQLYKQERAQKCQQVAQVPG